MGTCYKSNPSRTVKRAEVTLPLSAIVRDPLLRSRVGPLDRDHVAGMVESLRNDIPLPRPLVFHVTGRGHVLVGGWHTFEAHAVAECKEIACYVESNTWEQAVLAAAGQNQDHDRCGLKRSNADKRHAVLMLLAAFPDWSDRKIAVAVGVGNELPGEMRRRQVSDSDTSDEPVIRYRIGQDGKRYPLPIPDRVRPSGRAEHQEPLQPSWESNGKSVLPLLKNDIPLPKVLAANQLNLKQLSCVIGRWLDLFDGPVYCPVARRLLSSSEKADWLEWLITNSFPELYDEEAVFGDQLDVLRDERFPAGALP